MTETFPECNHHGTNENLLKRDTHNSPLDYRGWEFLRNPSLKKEKTEAYYKPKRNWSPRKRFHSTEITSQSTSVERLNLRQWCTNKWLLGPHLDQNCLPLPLTLKPKLHVKTLRYNWVSMSTNIFICFSSQCDLMNKSFCAFHCYLTL